MSEKQCEIRRPRNKLLKEIFWTPEGYRTEDDKIVEAKSVGEPVVAFIDPFLLSLSGQERQKEMSHVLNIRLTDIVEEHPEKIELLDTNAYCECQRKRTIFEQGHKICAYALQPYIIKG